MNRKQRRQAGTDPTGSADAAVIDDRLREAAILRDAQQFRDAVEIYQSILAAAPDHHPTLGAFGVTAIMAGEAALAVDLLQRAITAAGQDGDGYLSDLGYALATAERFDEALAVYRRAVAARPNDADAHFNLGNVLNALGRPG
ncbi:MAG: tetratricopeptide repeat protein, partial [Alphaproteobacteria bacterium]|nr:tetratricopeptide repeat protein [Alphaproteobacteria bacterium]